MRNLLYFRSNLRLHDNLLVKEALQTGSEVLFIIKLQNYAFRPSPKSKFYWETIEDLRLNLRKKGHELILFKGDSADYIGELQDRFEFKNIFVDQISAYYEKREIRRIENKISKTIITWTSDRLIGKEDLPFAIEKMPSIFTEFRKIVEKSVPFYGSSPVPFENCAPLVHDLENLLWSERPKFLSPNSLMSPHKTAFPFHGGETNGIKRLDDYFFKRKLLSHYKETRNGMLGPDYSSKFSPWLANGSLSPKFIWEKILDYENQVESNSSTYWLKFELLWREYFRWLYEKYEVKFFQKNGINNKENLIENDCEVLKSWKEGKTHDDFINANMIELNKTGYMSNRGRQNVGSYLVHCLKQDWREGAKYFEETLIDYDVFSNWGNWLYVAGVGTDPRSRVFNPIKQAKMYDPNREFQNFWLNENGSF